MFFSRTALVAAQQLSFTLSDARMGEVRNVVFEPIRQFAPTYGFK
jgi:hypothetical protein